MSSRSATFARIRSSIPGTAAIIEWNSCRVITISRIGDVARTDALRRSSSSSAISPKKSPARQVGQMPLAVHHLGGAVDDREELVPEPVAADQVVPGVDIDLVRPAADLFQLGVREPLKQADLGRLAASIG